MRYFKIGIIILTLMLVSCQSDFKTSSGMTKTKSIFGLYGFKDSQGKQIIENKFKEATDFKGYAAIVKENNKYGVINKQGEFILKPKYPKINFLSNDYIKVYSSLDSYHKKCKIVTYTGKEIIPNVLRDVDTVYNSKYFIVEKRGHSDWDNYFILMDIDLNEFDYRFDDYKYLDGLFYFRNDDKYSILDPKNLDSELNQLKDVKYLKILNPEGKKYEMYFQLEEDNSNLIVDYRGKLLEGLKRYNEVMDYTDGLFMVEGFSTPSLNTLKKGYATKTGDLKFKMVFDYISAFKNGKAKVNLGGDTYFYINKKGECVYDCPTDKYLEYYKVKNWTVDNRASNIEFGLGKIEYANGNFSKAIDRFNKSIDFNPMNEESLFYRGSAYLSINSFENAIKDFKKSILLNENKIESYKLISYAYKKKGDFDEELSYLKKGANLNPNSYDLNLQISSIYAEREDKYNSCKYLLKACDLKYSNLCYELNDICNSIVKEEDNFFDNWGVNAQNQDTLNSNGEIVKLGNSVRSSFETLRNKDLEISTPWSFEQPNDKPSFAGPDVDINEAYDKQDDGTYKRRYKTYSPKSSNNANRINQNSNYSKTYTSCSDLIDKVKRNGSSSGSYTSYNSSAIDEIEFYSLYENGETSYYAIVEFTTSSEQYIYKVLSNTEDEYAFNYNDSAGEAYHEYIKPYSNVLGCSPNFD